MNCQFIIRIGALNDDTVIKQSPKKKIIRFAEKEKKPKGEDIFRCKNIFKLASFMLCVLDFFPLQSGKCFKELCMSDKRRPDRNKVQ